MRDGKIVGSEERDAERGCIWHAEPGSQLTCFGSGM